MKRRILLSMLAVAAAAAVPFAAMAAKHNKKIEIGQAAPAFTGLKGTDGKDHSLADYKDAKAVVVVFTCNACPIAVAYEDRLVDLQKKYADKGVQVLAINCKTSEQLADLKTRAEEKKYNFPYLRDEAQQSGRDFGATCTPHVFLLDGSRKIAYMGAIDDNDEVASASKPYLTDAIDAVLAGKAPAVTETKQRGCGIRYQ